MDKQGNARKYPGSEGHGAGSITRKAIILRACQTNTASVEENPVIRGDVSSKTKLNPRSSLRASAQYPRLFILLGS